MQQWALQKNFIHPKIRNPFYNKGQSALKRKRIIKDHNNIQLFRRNKKVCNQRGIMFNLETFIPKHQSQVKPLTNPRKLKFITCSFFLNNKHHKTFKYKWMINRWKERKKLILSCKMYLNKLLKSTLNWIIYFIHLNKQEYNNNLVLNKLHLLNLNQLWFNLLKIRNICIDKLILKIIMFLPI